MNGGLTPVCECTWNPQTDPLHHLLEPSVSAQELQPSKESDEEGTDDGKQRDKKRKEVSHGLRKKALC